MWFVVAVLFFNYVLLFVAFRAVFPPAGPRAIAHSTTSFCWSPLRLGDFFFACLWGAGLLRFLKGH